MKGDRLTQFRFERDYFNKITSRKKNHCRRCAECARLGQFSSKQIHNCANNDFLARFHLIAFPLPTLAMNFIIGFLKCTNSDNRGSLNCIAVTASVLPNQFPPNYPFVIAA
jgi:hypothetical protein